MTRVVTRVQAHPIREEMASRLAGRISGEVIWDPLPDGGRCPWRTYREALCAAIDDDVTHIAVVQDDAIVCDRFPETVELVAAARPGNPVCLFVPGALPIHYSAIQYACEHDETITLLPDGSWVPVVAVLWPVDIACLMVDWADRQGYPETFCADDEIVGRATRGIGIDVYATVPSIVEHPDDVHSLIGNHRAMGGTNPNRVAACFCGTDVDGRTISWA